MFKKIIKNWMLVLVLVVLCGYNYSSIEQNAIQATSANGDSGLAETWQSSKVCSNKNLTFYIMNKVGFHHNLTQKVIGLKAEDAKRYFKANFPFLSKEFQKGILKQLTVNQKESEVKGRHIPPRDKRCFAEVFKFNKDEVYIKILRPLGGFRWHHYFDCLAIYKMRRNKYIDNIFSLDKLYEKFSFSYKSIKHGMKGPEMPEKDNHIIKTLGKPDYIFPSQSPSLGRFYYKKDDIHIETHHFKIYYLEKGKPAWVKENNRSNSDSQTIKKREIISIKELSKTTPIMPMTFGIAPWRRVIAGKKSKIISRFPQGSDKIQMLLSVPNGLPVPKNDYEGKLYDKVFDNSISVTPDSNHIAYLAENNGKTFVVVDHREEPSFKNIAYDTIILSNDGSRVAYSLGHHKGEVLDGQLLPDSKFIQGDGNGYVVFSGDSKHYAYSIFDDTLPAKCTSVLYKDGKQIRTYKKTKISYLQFHPDNQNLIYIFSGVKSHRTVISGKPGPEFKRIEHFYPGFEKVFFHSPDKKRIAYVGLDDGVETLVINQKAKEKIKEGEILNIIFSANSQHYAIVLSSQEDGKWFVKCNGISTTPRGYIAMGSIKISPNGKHLVYTTTNAKGKRIYIVDDSEWHPPSGWNSVLRFDFTADSNLTYHAMKHETSYSVVEKLH